MLKKVFYIALLAVSLTACGYESRDNELSGQAKKIVHATPLFCPNHDDFEVSMGIVRNGTGSMSTEDVWFTVQNPEQIAVLKKAADAGSIVHVKYDVRRFAFCQHNHILTDVIIEQ